MTGDRYGQIISFYSYKGGVGRSMALANVAALLCRSGRTVLAVDWDLEAPGLDKFFEQSSQDLRTKVQSSPGILELLCGLTKYSKFEWRNCAVDVGLRDGQLFFISSGKRDKLYGSRLQSLRWDVLYDEYGFGQALEDMREEWKQTYDYVLLDSRTGVTDIGDVCTSLLPDLLVTVFVANEQNIEGTKMIIERARAVHGQLPRDRTKLLVVPLLGRDEIYTEYELSSSWRKRISDELGFTLSDWLPKEVDAPAYFQKVFIPYYSFWSFGENIPVIQREKEIGNPTSISAAYGRLASLLDSGLDWSVLEKGVDSAEINSLRSRASLGEAKSAELEASRQEIESLQARARGKTTLLWLSVAFTLLVMATIFAGFVFVREREAMQSAVAAREQAEERAQKGQDAIVRAQKQLADARTNLDTLTRQLEDQKTLLTKQISDLQKQNADLLSQLQSQNLDTQRKLDEIIRQNNSSR